MKTNGPEGHPTPLPAYDKPPVIEVVCGIEFNALEKFKAPYLGLFWHQLRDRFTTCEHAPPLGAFTLPKDDIGIQFPPLPRVWLINELQNKLIQLQNDRFLFNWRRMTPDEPYPHYDEIIQEFRENLRLFQDFVQTESLGSISLIENELSYINHIPIGDGWNSLSEIGEIFPDLSWSQNEERFLPKPENWNWRTAFKLPNDRGQLLIRLHSASRKVDQAKLLILEVKAKGLIESNVGDSTWEWFNIAHEWIVRGFTDLTGSDIQQNQWQRSV
jgi:uncharacterized protein (TIGR04255 family)